MIKTTTSVFLFFCFTSITTAQSLSSKVVDSITQKPIPYATILLSKKSGVITNEEGNFNLRFNQNNNSKDSITISCIGYKTKTILNKVTLDSIIYLSPKAIELGPVILTNKEYTAEEIIDLVKENSAKNYPKSTIKRRLFFRESYFQNMAKSDIHFKKSTIKAFNEHFIDSVMQTVPKKYEYYTEILCDLYSDKESNKKIALIKASELYDKSNEISLSKLEEKLNDIIKKNVKPNSYFKVKSGIFGTKMDMDEFLDEENESKKDSTDTVALKKYLEEEKKKEADKKKHYANHKKDYLNQVLNSQFFNEQTFLNVILKSSRYNFQLIDFTFLGDQPVYQIDYEPKRSEKFKGRLYINADDFAVIRVDFENIKSLKKFGLLGVSMNDYYKVGKMFFSKGTNNNYNLHYYEVVRKNRIGIDRPLKIIEKNKHVKGRRKQNELSVGLDIVMQDYRKYQAIVFNTENISESDFTNYEEKNKVLATYMRYYDPTFWEGYQIIEPNTAIKEFTVETK